MSETEINDLPNEIITKILRFLDPFELRKVMFTCKLWKNIIESAYPFPLKLNGRASYDDSKINFLLTTNRKFKEIELNERLGLDETVIGIVRRHGFNVFTLSLNDVCFYSLSEFAGILNSLPNLRELITLKTIALMNDVPAEDDLPELRNLKTIQMACTQYRILKCLKKVKLTTIKVLNSTYRYSMDCSYLEEFIKSQDMLTTLAIRSIYHDKSMLFRTQNLSASMPFQLTHLSLNYIQLELDLKASPNNYNNLLKFMEQQAKSLVELELGHRFPGFVYEFVFAKMKNLKTLNVLMGQIPQENELFERLMVNRSITNLVFKESPRYSNESIQFYRNFLECLPNVTSLTIMNDCCQEIMLVVAQTLKKLETLRLNDGTCLQGLQFANLNSLHISNFIEEDFDWNEFTKANSKLTELTIDYDGISIDNIESITNNTNLHTLRIGEGFEADRRLLEIIRKNCPDLKRLELCESCGLSNELTNHSDLLGLTRFSKNELIDYPYQYSTFWHGFPYDDVDEWEEDADVVDMFDYHMMDIDMEMNHRYFGYDDDDDRVDDEEQLDWNDDERYEFEHSDDDYDIW